MASFEATIQAGRPPSDERDGVRPQIAALVPAAPAAAIAASTPYSPAPPPADIASGEPVDVPTVEVIGFDEPAPAAAPPPDSAPAILSPPEPIAEPAVEPTLAATGRLAALVQQWRGAVAISPTRRWRPVIYWGRWAVAAATIVAVMYIAGIGPFARSVPFQRSSGAVAPVPSDPVQRLAYFQNGAKAGDPEAELQLAILYAKGEGVTQDYATAASWFQAAAAQGSARAQYDLGVLYERGRGVPADPEQAAKWYLKGAEGKYPLAQYNLAVAYTKGLGVRQDMTEAALWYRRAAGQGVVQAMANLGMLYERGDGVAVSPVDAYAWYLAAGRRGNQPAARRAEDLFNAFSRQDQIRAEALASDVAGSIHEFSPESGATPSG